MRFSIRMPFLLALTLIMTVLCTPATADDRAAHLKEKLPFMREVICIDGTFVHNVGNLQMNVTNWGFLGSLPKSYYPMAYSPSAQWPPGSGVEYLYAAGLWVGAVLNGIPAVSTGYPETEFYPPKDPRDIIYRSFEGDTGGNRYPGPPDDDRDGLVDEEWLNGRDDDEDGLIDEDFEAVGKQMFSCWYSDDQKLSSMIWPEHTPMHIHVRQETYQWAEEGLNDFVGVHYRITNTGSYFLTNVMCGIYADVDAGPRQYGNYHLDDLVGLYEGWVCAPKGNAETPVKVRVAYVYDDDGDNGKTPGYFGIAILGHTTDKITYMYAPYDVRINTFRVFRGLHPYVSGGDPTDDYERYDVLSKGTKDEDMLVAMDYRMLLSVGPFGILPPDSSIEFDIAYVCGEGLDGMLKNAATAQLVYMGIWIDRDNDKRTGIIGRETPVPGKKKKWDPDPCDDSLNAIFVPKGTICWSNLDCREELERWHYSYRECLRGDETFEDFQTGVLGKESQLNWITGSAPPPPNMRIVPGDNRVTIFWDNLSEVTPDVLTRYEDFEGYEIWRAEDWHRPFGTTTLSGPSTHLWGLFDTGDLVNGIPPDNGFDKPYSEGGWIYEPLIGFPDRDKYIRMFEESIVYAPMDTVPCPPGLSGEVCDTLEAIAKYNLGLEGGRRYYKYIDEEVKNGLPYFYSVTSYDHTISKGRPVSSGRHNSPASNFTFVIPRSDAQLPEQFRKKDVYVVPNPVSSESLEPWRLDPSNDDPSGVKVEFRNLPRCRNTVRIYTVSGDLVQVLYHDGRDGNGTQPWNLVSRNGQDITSGVYLFSVEPSDERFPRILGKFVVIR